MRKPHPSLRSVFEQGIARLMLIVGGTFAQIARYPRISNADLVLYLDVHKELRSISLAPSTLHLALARGETLGTLMKGHYSDDSEQGKYILKFLQERPAADLDTGLAQFRPAGNVASKKLIDAEAFRRFLQELVFEPLILLHNGSITKVELSVWASAAGGTGGPAGGPVAAAIADLFRDFYDASIDIRYHRAGGLSFIGLGPRVSANTWATTRQDVDFICDPRRAVSEVRSVMFFELPMLGANRSLRDSFALQMAQALNASSVRRILDIAAPNDAVASKLGATTIVGLSFWNELPRELIAATAARRYTSGLRRLLLRPSEHIVRDLELALTNTSTSARCTAGDLLKRIQKAGGQEPPDLEEDCLHVSLNYNTVRISAEVNPGTRINLASGWRKLYADPCKVESEFAKKLSVLKAIAASLELELHRRRSRLEEVQVTQGRAKTQLREVLNEFFPQGWKRFSSLFEDPRKRNARFKTRVETARRAAAEALTLEAEVAALDRVQEELSKDLTEETRRIESLIEMLAGATPTSAEENKPAVEVADLDDVLPRLLSLAIEKPINRGSLIETLASCTLRVTEAGLAQIVRSPEVSLATIAHRLVREEPPVRSPHWGGKEPLSPGEVVVVLPPVSSSAQDALEKHVRALTSSGQQVQVAWCDTSEAGANVVHLELRKPLNSSEIFTPFIARQEQVIKEAGELPLYLELSPEVQGPDNGAPQEKVFPKNPR